MAKILFKNERMLYQWVIFLDLATDHIVKLTTLKSLLNLQL